MSKYMVLWRVDEARTPINPQERKNLWLGFQASVKLGLKAGLFKDWGSFAGEMDGNHGYAIAEGNEVEIAKELQKYVPFAAFKVVPILSLAQNEEVAKSIK